MKDMKVGFIGFGNMAQALARGFVRTGALSPDRIGACARDAAKLRRNTEPHGFRAFDCAEEVAAFADVVIVAVKPHQVEPVVVVRQAPVVGSKIDLHHGPSGDSPFRLMGSPR